MSGFSEAGFIAGSVFGYRWWTLAAPPLHLSPAHAEENWQPGLLRGTKDFWQPGVNQAKCLPWAGYGAHDPGEIPSIACSCGYWAYWEIQPHDLSTAGSLPVVGVVRGTGQVLSGPLGFRAGKAKVVALHLPFVIGPDPSREKTGQLDHGHPRQYGAGNPWYNHPQFHGKVISIGIEAPHCLQRREIPPPPPEPTPEEIAEAADRAEAWMAVIGDRLAQAYPGAEIFETLKLLLARFPPDPQYSEPALVTCDHCQRQYPDIHEHYKSCAALLYPR